MSIEGVTQMATQTLSAEYERALSENERYVAQFDRSRRHDPERSSDHVAIPSSQSSS